MYLDVFLRGLTSAMALNPSRGPEGHLPAARRTERLVWVTLPQERRQRRQRTRRHRQIGEASLKQRQQLEGRGKMAWANEELAAPAVQPKSRGARN